jgi:hypothetical protein
MFKGCQRFLERERWRSFFGFGFWWEKAAFAPHLQVGAHGLISAKL